MLTLDGSRRELSEAAVPAEVELTRSIFAKATSRQYFLLLIRLCAGCFHLADVILHRGRNVNSSCSQAYRLKLQNPASQEPHVGTVLAFINFILTVVFTAAPFPAAVVKMRERSARCPLAGCR